MMEGEESVVGLIGLSVMGQNLALNVGSKGFTISVWNRSPERVKDTVERAKVEGDLPLRGFLDLGNFVKSLSRPRSIIIMVQAGIAVDNLLEQLFPLLSPDDLVIDAGNEWYETTERRQIECAERNIRFCGLGVSGGEEGARHGPALMFGGDERSFKQVDNILCKIAAQVDGNACLTYTGPGGSGHYVKMVHNGIEYGDMQIIAEACAILKSFGFLNEQIHEAFRTFARGPLKSYLVEITALIFKCKDDLTVGKDLIDMILDVAGSKGTGMWTVREAVLRGVCCPTIAAALDARNISRLKEERVRANFLYSSNRIGVNNQLPVLAPEEVQSNVGDAMYCSKLCSYAQGLMLLKDVSEAKGWNLNLSAIVNGWKGGCIIRAEFLTEISAALSDKSLPSILLSPAFVETLGSRCLNWRSVVNIAQDRGVPVGAMAASLNYFHSYTSSQLSLNVIQAQRDCFGAHTYQRVDRDGVFHYPNWSSSMS